MLFIIAFLIMGALALLLYYFKPYIFGNKESHLPKDALIEDRPEKDIFEERYLRQAEGAWVPLTPQIKRIEGRIPVPFISGLKKKLAKAGFPIGVMDFLAFKALAMIAVPIAAFAFLGRHFSMLWLFVFSLAAGFMLPDMWLNAKIKKRQHHIRRDLPNVIDLLNLCVSGGIDFMLAVNIVTRELKACELTQELSEVYRQTQMGKTRREALKDLAERLDMPEIHSFARTLIQADRMGTPLADALNLQSEEIRVRRFQQGEAMALKAPIKLLFPLFAFILPVVLIIVGGPILLQFVRGSINFAF